MCNRFLIGEMLTENREFHSFEPGISLEISLAKTVNALPAPSIAEIYVLKRYANF